MMKKLLVLSLFAAWCSPSTAAKQGFTDYSALHLRTGERHWSRGPQPTVVTLSGSVEDALDGPSAALGNLIAQDVGALHVAIDLPAHGADGIGTLTEWADRIRNGDDLIGKFIAQLRLYLAYLVEHGYSDPNRIVLVGVSRGAFLALHSAAQGLGTQVIAITPVVTLGALTEFADLRTHSYVVRSHLGRGAPYGLYRYPIYMVAGLVDVRVSTNEAINFYRGMVAVGPSPNLIFRLVPATVGHTLDEPQEEYREAATWLETRWANKYVPHIMTR